MSHPQAIQGERLYGTTEERHVLALELIADELVLICQQLERLGDRFCEPQKVPDQPDSTSPDIPR